jgi:hypothetical protein
MKTLLLFCFVIFLGGCGKGQNSHQTREAQTLETGFQLLDQRRFDEAILYFQEMFETQPTDDALKAWASAYIAKAGLNVPTLLKALLALPEKKELKTDSDLINQIYAYKKSFEKIPYVEGASREDIQKAATLLKLRNSASVRLLRSFLNLILLRSSLADGDQSFVKADFKYDLDKNLKGICKLEWKKLDNWIQSWSKFGTELMNDLDLAYPSRKKEWQEGEKFFHEVNGFSFNLVTTCDL